MDDQQRVLNQPFDIETHQRTFIDYLEVVISEDGTIMYAVPSHQEKLIRIACQKRNISRDELIESCPREYYARYMEWLCDITKCVLLWNDFMVGEANAKQQESIAKLIEAKLYSGSVNESVS